MAHRFRESTGPTRLGKKARPPMRWRPLETNFVMLGTVAATAIAIALFLWLLVPPPAELQAQTNSAPTVSTVSPSSPVSLTTGGSQTFQVSFTDADNNLTKWEWEVDKHFSLLHGHQEPEETFAATGSITKSFSHTFPDNGTYTVTVTFTDSDGESGSAEWRVEVADPPNRAPSASRVSPGGLEYVPTGDVTFTVIANDPDDNLKRYEWFVDGTSEDDGSWLLVLPTGSVTKTFTHTFSTAGEYTVKVTFTDDDGLSASVSWTVIAVDPITIQLDADNYTVNEDDGEVETTVSISASPPEGLSVRFRTSDGTADTGDYSPKTVLVSFPRDTTTLTQMVPVTIVNDNTVESTEETLTVTLRTSSIGLPTYVSLTRSQATVKVLDDDEATVAFTTNTIRAREDDGVLIGLEVETDPPTACGVAVPFDAHFSYTDLHGTFSSTATILSSISFRPCYPRLGYSIFSDNFAGIGVVTGPTEVVFTLDRVASADTGVARRGDGWGPFNGDGDHRGQ